MPASVSRAHNMSARGWAWASTSSMAPRPPDRTRSSGSWPSGSAAKRRLRPGRSSGSARSAARKAARRPAESFAGDPVGGGALERILSLQFRKWLPATVPEGKSRIKPAHHLTLVPLHGAYAVCRLAADVPVPDWAAGGPFVSITRTAEELSVVCPETGVPEGTRCERGWRALRVAGALDFSLTGALASLLGPLADADVSAFALSTFDTDYLLVKEKDLPRAEQALRRAGHVLPP